MNNPNRRVLIRLLPLYIAAFLQSCVFWYAVEKIFMTTIGFNSTTIAIMVVLYLATMLLFEIPSGIFADRWSRKAMLVISGLMMALCSLVAGVSNGLLVYYISTVFYGIYIALYSGMYDSVVYDLLIEDTGSAKLYEKYYGRVTLVEGLALMVSSIIGGWAGQVFGLRQSYLMTIPFALMSIIFLLFFREPKLHLKHKEEHKTPFISQVKKIFKVIIHSRLVIYLVLAAVLTGLISEIVFEFDQIWLIALSTPIGLYGPINALLLSSVVISGWLIVHLAKSNQLITKIVMVLIVLSGLSLVLLKNVYAVALAEFTIVTFTITYGILLKRYIHDRLPSSLRSGAMSAISSFTTIIFIPIALVFGYLSDKIGIFNSAWILVIVLVTAAFTVVKAVRGAKYEGNTQA